MADGNDPGANTALALRVATASALCLVLGEWMHLEQQALSVYTCHVSMTLFPYTAFQKIMERLVGRLAGVLFGVFAVIYFRDAPLLLLVTMLIGQQFFFYIYTSGRLAYASLMGGIFLGVVIEIGVAKSPAAAEVYAVGLAEQLILATVVILAVNFFSGAERVLAIDAGGKPLLPFQPIGMSKASMVNVGQVLAMFVAFLADLPPLPTLVSATVLTLTTNDAVAMGGKAFERALGAFLAMVYAGICIALLALLPELGLLAALVFLGIFLAAYYTKQCTTYTYTFQQAGLVMPMVLITSHGGIGSIDTALQRLIGVVAGLAIAEAVYICWPFPLVEEATASPQVVEPGTQPVT